MAEPKYIYRPVPCPVFRVEAFQCWLEDMARKGLILYEKDNIILGVATFIRQTPRHLRYRLEPTPKQAGSMNDYDTPDAQALELNAQFGWKYVTRYGQFYIYRCGDPTAPELHTDPQLQEINLLALKKRTRKAFFWSIFNAIFLCWLNLGFVLTLGCAFLGTPLVAGGILILGESFAYRALEVIHFKKLCRRLQLGDAPTRKADWKRGRFLFRARSFLSTILPVVWLVACFTAKPDGEYLLRDNSQPLPFATLAEVFPEAQVTIDDSVVDSELKTYTDLLIPETMEYTFYGDVQFDKYESSHAILHLNYHRTVSPFLARQIVREYQRHAARQRGIFSKKDWIPYDMSAVSADFIVCYNEGINVILLLCKGNEVIRCQYLNRGHDTDPEIEHFAQVMAGSIG